MTAVLDLEKPEVVAADVLPEPARPESFPWKESQEGTNHEVSAQGEIDPDSVIDSDSQSGTVAAPIAADALEESKKPQTPPKGPERRHDIRYPYHWRVLLQQSNGRQILCRTMDVSRSGCCLVVQENVHPQQSVLLYLELPPVHSGTRGEVLTLDARVARTTLSSKNGGFVLGVHFTKQQSPGVLRLQKQLGRGSAQYM